MFKRFFARSSFSEPGLELYAAAVTQARDPAFYTALGVPDTLDGRFDLLALHCYLLMRRLKRQGAEATLLSQELAEIFFADMDVNLREIGASDIGVGKRVKRMIEGYYGRVQAYDQALLEGEAPLQEALRRNVYGTCSVAPAVLAALAAYLRAAEASLAGQAWSALQRGAVAFPAAGAAEGAA